jgi:hypothetical protein
MGYRGEVSSRPRQVRWIEEADDPELEERLVKELEARREARREERVRRAQDKRSRRMFLLFSLVTLALVTAIGYAVVAIARAHFG